MASLGSFGTEREPLDLDFNWFGETIRVNPDASDLDFMEFMQNAENIELPDDLEGLTASQQAAVMNTMTAVTTAMNAFVRGQIHPQDWERFWRTAKAHRQQNSDLMQLSRDITAAVARFPTGRSSGSGTTPSTTSPKSSAAASSTARRERVTGHALELLKGRPDLKLALINQRNAESAA